MKRSNTKIDPTRILFPLLALAILPSTMYGATTLTLGTISGNITCNTSGIPAAVSATVTVKASAAATVAVSGPAQLTVSPATVTFSSTNFGTNQTVTLSAKAGCSGAAAGTTASLAINFTGTGVTAASVNATEVVTVDGSSLVASPTSILFSATTSDNGSTWSPASFSGQDVSVTSSISGAPFVRPVIPTAATWLTENTPATTAPATLTLTSSACGTIGTSSATVPLTTGSGGSKSVLVTKSCLKSSPVTASVGSTPITTSKPASLNYTKGSGAAGRVDVTLTATPAAFYTVDTSSLPVWLTVDLVTGLTPKTPRFSTTSMADNLAPGTYKANVSLQVSGFGDLKVPFTLLVSNPAPKFTINEGLAVSLSWKPGDPALSSTLTPISTGSAIPYSITTGGTLAPIIAPQFLSGLAYSFGNAIPVTFDPLVFAAAQPGTTLTGTVTFSWGTPVSTTVVTISVNITSGTATVSALNPGSLPTAASGQFYVTMVGAGFVVSVDPAVRTKVGLIANTSGAPVVSDTNISYNVIDSSHIYLQITVSPGDNANLPFSPAGNGGTVYLAVCNPGANGICSVQTGYAPLSIGNSPIITAVTSASAYIQQPAPLQTVAPYDIISIFGNNFCTSGGTGCGSNQILPAAPTGAGLVYPIQLSPDPSNAAHQRFLTVSFQQHNDSSVITAAAPLLFATNNQINVMAPAALGSHVGEQVDVVVNFGYGLSSAVPATLFSSQPYGATVATSSPGVFTVGSDGQGDGAILDSNWALIGANQPAGLRANLTDSDQVAIYMTGLGVPTSTVANTAGSNNPPRWSTDCVSPGNYLSALSAGVSPVTVSSLDGAVISSKWLAANLLAPCFLSSGAPAVTVGGQTAVVKYAGWVQDTIAGLYQVNVQLPSLTPVTGVNGGNFTARDGTQLSAIIQPVQLPVKVSFNGNSSQDGVTMWVTPRLKVGAPSGVSNGYLQGTVGTALTTSGAVTTVTVSGGTGTIRFAVTSGLLPAGLSLSTAGVISGTPAANTDGIYKITVTATDQAPVPVTGAVTFLIKIGQGLVLTTNTVNSGAFGSVGTLTTVSAAGGVYPYTFSISSPVSALTLGFTIDSTPGASSPLGMTAALRAGTYTVTLLATDSAGVTGTISFDVTVGLVMAHDTVLSPTKAAGGTVTNYTTTGQTGSLTYTLDTPSSNLGFQVNSSGIVSLSSTNTVTIGSTYSLTITTLDGSIATGAKTGGYGAGTSTIATVTIAKNAQVITFNQPPVQTYAPGATYTLVATAPGGTVAFTVTSGPGTITGTTLTITGAGQIVVAADQASGNATYSGAPTVSRTITVDKATQTITFVAPTTLSRASGAITLSGTTSAGGLTVTYIVTNGTGTASLSGASLTGLTNGTITVTATVTGDPNYADATLAPQTITIAD